MVGVEIAACMGDGFAVNRVIERLHPGDGFFQRGGMALNMLQQFGLGVCGAGDQDCAGRAHPFDHFLQKLVVLGGVAAADRI